MKVLDKYIVGDEKKKKFKSDKIKRQIQKFKDKYGHRFQSQEMAKAHIEGEIRRYNDYKAWWDEEEFKKIINQY